MAKKSARKPNAAFMKPVTPDATLAAVVGSTPMPRTELTKKLWAYIKKNGLQDKKVKTQINADDKLKAVFGGKKAVSMFEMTKLVSNHVSRFRPFVPLSRPPRSLAAVFLRPLSGLKRASRAMPRGTAFRDCAAPCGDVNSFRRFHPRFRACLSRLNAGPSSQSPPS
jgi:hypothetical protein